MPRICRLPLLAAGFALASSAHAMPPQDPVQDDDSARPVLVELFTSQGCNSCPPADAFLGELARRPGVLALAFHVDYWNGLGWKDPFSSATATARQNDYAKRLGKRSIYTPQLVVDGTADAVGSDRADVDALIAAARRRAAAGPAIEIAEDGQGGRVARLGAQSGAGETKAADAGVGGKGIQATVWLASYDRSHVTPVGRGENGGRTLTEYQVVRSLVRLGEWTGTAAEFPLPKFDGESAVLFVQPDQPGPILAAKDLAG